MVHRYGKDAAHFGIAQRQPAIDADLKHTCAQIHSQRPRRRDNDVGLFIVGCAVPVNHRIGATQNNRATLDFSVDLQRRRVEVRQLVAVDACPADDRLRGDPTTACAAHFSADHQRHIQIVDLRPGCRRANRRTNARAADDQLINRDCAAIA